MGTTPAAMSPQQINGLQRQAVLQQAVSMTQNISSSTVFPPSNPVLNIVPRNVGLIKRFIVEIVGTIVNGGGAVATLTDNGISNILSQVQFTDLNNNVRINTSGLHLSLLASAKRRHPYIASSGFNAASGNNVSGAFNVAPGVWGVFQAPATIASGATGTIRIVYEIPLAYTNHDLRGAVYANVINASMNLQLTFNQNACSASTDTTFSVYGGSAGTFSQATVNIYQEYLDQLPVGKNGVVLPIMDISTVYELKNTTFSAISPNNDYPIPFTNFRDFHSVFTVYNNNGLTAGRTYGTDINYWALQSANFTNIWKIDPLLAAARAREVFGTDLPAGTYYHSFREKPISTTQYGNMELVVNPITATANAYVTAMWEDMALVNTLTSAGSLAG